MIGIILLCLCFILLRNLYYGREVPYNQFLRVDCYQAYRVVVFIPFTSFIADHRFIYRLGHY